MSVWFITNKGIFIALAAFHATIILKSLNDEEQTGYEPRIDVYD